MKKGDFAKVPLIIGTNMDEGQSFILQFYQVQPGMHVPMSDADADHLLGHIFNSSTVEQLDDFYPPVVYKNNNDRIAYIMRDYFFACDSRRVVRILEQHGVPSFLYQFTANLSNWKDYLEHGDHHTIELPFVFNHQVFIFRFSCSTCVSVVWGTNLCRFLKQTVATWKS
eukprot:m.176714 g.176714  ORF g.176714 m.176714 type:complete len:169 (+) comp25312_c0_seq7:109-615(+)